MHQPATVEFVLRESDSASSYAVFENLLLTFGHGPPTATNAKLFSSLVTDLAAKYPRGAGVFVFVQCDSSPTPDGRDALLAAFRALHGVVSFAFVVESQSLAATAQRAIIRTLLFASRFRDSIRMETSTESAIRWLCARVKPGNGKTWDVPAIQRAAMEFCSQQSAYYAALAQQTPAGNA